MARSNLSLVQEAIAIQGFITISVAGRDRKAKSIKEVDGDWMTDIPTSDLCGYIRIRNTKGAVVKHAKWIIEHAAEIRAARDERVRRAASLAIN